MSTRDDYEVVIVKYGTRQTTRSEVFLNYPIYAEADAPMRMDYFFWVVRNPERTVLVDCGFSQAGGEARKRTFVIEPAEAYAALGIEPASVATVIVTHAHYDHIGNLGLFPSAEIILAEQEYAFWTGPHRRREQFHHSVEEVELNHLEAAYSQGRVRTFTDRLELAPGIEVITIGGHTPGQCVVAVRTNDGPVLLASDSIHYYEEYERDRPFSSTASVVGMYEAFDRIRAMTAGAAGWQLVSGHDPDTLARFRPLKGPLSGIAASIGGGA